MQQTYWGEVTKVEFCKHQEMMASLSQYLVKIRHKVSTELNQFPPLINHLQCDRDRLRSTENLRTITRFMSAVQSVLSTVTSLMTMFTSVVIGKAVGVCGKADRKSTRLNSSHVRTSRMPSSA